MSARADARQAVGSNAERLRQLDEGLKTLGLEVATVAPAAPALSDDTMAAAKQMTETDRNAMVRGMVDRLAARLKQNGDDVEGWLRLVRSYMVMGDGEKAMSARADARQAVGSNAERLRQLDEGLKTLGLEVATVAPAAPALSDDTMAAAKQMTETDRNAMIRGMVDRLATRLKQNGDDVEGWLRLVRAY